MEIGQHSVVPALAHGLGLLAEEDGEELADALGVGLVRLLLGVGQQRCVDGDRELLLVHKLDNGAKGATQVIVVELAHGHAQAAGAQHEAGKAAPEDLRVLLVGKGEFLRHLLSGVALSCPPEVFWVGKMVQSMGTTGCGLSWEPLALLFLLFLGGIRDVWLLV